MKASIEKELILHIYENIEFAIGYAVHDLHYHLFIIGSFIDSDKAAKEWLIKHDLCAFEAISILKQYEEEKFDKVYTDFSKPERVVNMLLFNYGEELIYRSETAADEEGDLYIEIATKIVDEILEKSKDN